MSKQEEKDDGLHRQSTEEAAGDPNGAPDTGDQRAKDESARKRARLVDHYCREADRIGLTVVGIDHDYAWVIHKGTYDCSASMRLSLDQLGVPLGSLSTEIKAGELRAWRCWRVNSDGSFRSMAMETPWQKDKPIEGDVSYSGQGVHAWKTKEDALKYGADGYAAYTIIVGTVDLWGTVVEHEKGYRAQFGQMREIVEVRPAPNQQQQLAYNQQLANMQWQQLGANNLMNAAGNTFHNQQALAQQANMNPYMQGLLPSPPRSSTRAILVATPAVDEDPVEDGTGFVISIIAIAALCLTALMLST